MHLWCIYHFRLDKRCRIGVTSVPITFSAEFEFFPTVRNKTIPPVVAHSVISYTAQLDRNNLPYEWPT